MVAIEERLKYHKPMQLQAEDATHDPNAAEAHSADVVEV